MGNPSNLDTNERNENVHNSSEEILGKAEVPIILILGVSREEIFKKMVKFCETVSQ